MVIDAETTIPDIDEALGHLCRDRRAAATELARRIASRRIDTLLDARNALEHEDGRDPGARAE